MLTLGDGRVIILVGMVRIKMKDNISILSETTIKNKIFIFRDTQVMLDEDLAVLYGVKSKRLNEQVKRNIARFPEKFRFQLTQEEYDNLKFQIGTSNLDDSLRSQIATSSSNKQHGGRRYLPYVFTEQGVSMLSTVLRSETAIEVSIKIIDTFVEMRKFISQNNYLFQRMELLEDKQKNTDQKVDEILNAIESKNATVKQGIFFEGQFFDAYILISDILKQATKTITLIDNYIDEKTLLHLNTKSNENIKINIITKSISDELKLDIEKYNKQNNSLSVYEYKNSHDRFLILDEKIIYHIGASLKDLGNKWFAFSKLEDDNLELLKKVENILNGKSK